LESVGFHVDNLADLVNQNINVEKAIPVFLKWIPRITYPPLKECLIRALADPCAKPIAAVPLIQEFRRVAESSSEGIGWTLANALSVVADDSVFDDLVQLVRDSRYGRSREMLAVALGNMRNPQAVTVLTDLLSDEVVVGHAVLALGNLRAIAARSAVAKLASHPKAWIRKEVQKALRKMDSCSEKHQ
jgi:HEAT repeat protein